MIQPILASGLAVLLSTCGQPPHDGKDGAPGPKGEQGETGAPGANGHSVVFTKTPVSPSQCADGGDVLLIAVDLNDSGTLDPDDGNPASLVSCNGADGADGSDAPPTQFTPVAKLDPCGDAPGRVDEVMLRLQDGTVLASFSDSASGQNTRFSILPDGTYQTTDGDACVFTLAGGVITYENHHY